VNTGEVPGQSLAHKTRSSAVSSAASMRAGVSPEQALALGSRLPLTPNLRSHVRGLILKAKAFCDVHQTADALKRSLAGTQM